MTRRKVGGTTSTSTPTPVPSSTSDTSDPPKVESFVIGGKICNVIHVHQKSEEGDRLPTNTMIARGHIASNVDDMGEEGANFLINHKKDFPTTGDYKNYTYLFPLYTNDKSDKGFVRVITAKDWPCLTRIPDKGAWDKNYVLIHFVGLALPPGE